MILPPKFLLYKLHHHYINSLALRPSLALCVCVRALIGEVMGRPPCCDKSNVKKGPWTPEEDAKILAYVASNGTGNWTLVPQKAGLNRCGKSCRLRWTNYLRPDLKHDNFTPQEEDLIIEYHKAIGSRWSLIAKRLPGRTDNDVKNHWNTKLKKKLSKMGIDPLTHKPISQLFSDYGNISRDLRSTSSTEMMNGTTLVDHDQSQQLEENSSFSAAASNNLAHFQIINQESSAQPHFFNEAVSPTSCLSQSRPNLPYSHSTWSEFLVGDPINAKQEQECDYQYQQGIALINSVQHSEPPHSHFTGESENANANGSNSKNEAPTTSSSFVETILKRDSELQLEFPLLLDGHFEY